MKANNQNLFHTINIPNMVKLFIPFLFLFFSFKPVERNRIPVLPVIRKELKAGNGFQNVRIEGDISVILTNEPAGKVFIEGNQKDLNKIKTGFKNDIFVINVIRKNIFSKLTVYLSAITLQTIQLNGNLDISSNDYIKSQYLHLTLNGNINVKVKTMGEISIDSPDDIELIWKLPVMK